MHETEGHNKVLQVHTFGEHLGQIVGEEESVTPEALLKVPRLTSVTILKERKIVRSVNIFSKYLFILIIIVDVVLPKSYLKTSV
jgi:hypothetical protein